MAETIFDSKAEQATDRRLSAVWSKYADSYPQIPVRKVIGYGNLRNPPLDPKFV